MDIQSMMPGGVWLSHGGTGTPHYVVSPDHVSRLLAEGYKFIDDPRLVAEEQIAEELDESEHPTKIKKGQKK
jgi:hypothetical protein